MTGKTFQFDFREMNLSVDQIERVMGYPEGESQETVYDIVSKVLKEAQAICAFKAEYRIFENISFSESSRSLLISNVSFNIGKIIYGQIKKSGFAALFVCTAGREIGIRSRNAMKEGDLLEGYIYDVIGSEAVEAVADLMQDDMEAEMALSRNKITNRFSPGYCGWDVAEQHKLFSLMTDNYCGIRLNPSALMDPVKSVSGIIGIGENVNRQPYTCKLCNMKDCIYRRKA
jgi:hypothetical protein